MAEQYITQVAIAETSVKVWPAGTLLIAMYGEGKTRGRCSELRIPATTNQACAAVVLREEYEDRRPWMKLYLEATYEQNRSLASGGVQPNLNLGLIRSIEVPLPPLNIQEAILSDVDRQVSLGNALRFHVVASERRAAALRSSLLAQAFSGRLVAQDPDDEPADRLLKQRRQESAATTRLIRRTTGRVAKKARPQAAPTHSEVPGNAAEVQEGTLW